MTFLPYSVRRPSAIDRKGRSRDRGAALAGEEYGQGPDLLDGCEALVWLVHQQDVADHLVARDTMRLRLIVDLLLDERRPHIAGANSIAGDAELRTLERDHLGETHDAMLRRYIGRRDRRADAPVCRG